MSTHLNDAPSDTTSPPTWFLVVSIVLLIWNIMGVVAFVAQVGMSAEDIAALSPAEQALYKSIPIWATLAFACAVFGGALGCLALVLKKAIALPILAISLIGILVQMYHSFFVANSMEVYGPGAWIMPSLVVLLGIFLLWLAKNAKAKSWIN